MIDLYDRWINAKEAERVAVEIRRAIEDELFAQFDVGDAEGSTTINRDGYKVKVTTRYNRKIDSDLLQEIAAENGFTDYLSTLFRWKPDLDMKAWKAADVYITDILANAITTTPGRPSFSITKEGN